jgi:hypothetical protein
MKIAIYFRKNNIPKIHRGVTNIQFIYNGCTKVYQFFNGDKLLGEYARKQVAEIKLCT